jgi:hypothetical protein
MTLKRNLSMMAGPVRPVNFMQEGGRVSLPPAKLALLKAYSYFDPDR